MIGSEAGETSARSDGDARLATLQRLLADHPDAAVSAVDTHGNLVRGPVGVGLRDRESLVGRSPLEVVAPGSRSALVDALARAKRAGVAAVPIVAINGSPGTCHLIDLRDTHGVLVGLVVTDTAIDWTSELADRPEVVPKTGLVEKDAVAMIRHADDRICRILGYQAAEMIGMRSLDLIHPDDQQNAMDAWIEMLMSPRAATRLRARHRRADGTWIWMELTNTNMLDREDGCVVCDMIDISDEMTAVEELRQREQLLATLTEALPSGVVHVDRSRAVIFSNSRVHDLTGVDANGSLDSYVHAVAESDRDTVSRAIESAFEGELGTEMEVTFDPTRGQQRRCAVKIRPLATGNDNPVGVVICIDDITEAFVLRVELERRATTDELTNCLNRSAVISALELLLADGRDGTIGVAVAFVDLDGFKEVNDTFGHTAGDQLLARAAARLQLAAQPGDVIGRLGGDEFLIVLPQAANADLAHARVRSLIDALTIPLEVVAGVPMRIRASTGIAWTSDPLLEADTLIAAADRAMYQSKHQGSCEPILIAV
ncbi:MAG: diguanylate cyclase [Ilumatobacteraceae bacterium]